MKIAFFLSVAILLLSLAYSVGPGEVKVLEPQSEIVSNNDIIDGGFIGPGQTLSVTVSAKVDTGGKYGDGGNWDNLKADVLPEGWTATYSEYGPTLKINIKAPSNAAEGKYRLELSVNDEQDREKIGEKTTFYVDIIVKNDVVNMYVYPEQLTVSAGSPARYTVKIINPSTASDLFVVEGEGVPRWAFKKEVFVPGRGSATFYYEIVNAEEEVIPITIKATSKSSPKITAQESITLVTKSDPYYDIVSVRNGLLLYPPIESLLYSFIYIASAFA